MTKCILYRRYIAVGSSSTREGYFYEYTKSLEDREPELSEAEKKAIARKEREAAAMKKREGEVARKQVTYFSGRMPRDFARMRIEDQFG